MRGVARFVPLSIPPSSETALRGLAAANAYTPEGIDRIALNEAVFRPVEASRVQKPSFAFA